MTKTVNYWELEQRIAKRVGELTAGQHPAFNVTPTADLVRLAYSMGYEVVPQSAVEPADKQFEIVGNNMQQVRDPRHVHGCHGRYCLCMDTAGESPCEHEPSLAFDVGKNRTVAVCSKCAATL